jgi:hypothetical protein
VSGTKFTSSGRKAISRNSSSDFFSLLVRSAPVAVKNEKLCGGCAVAGPFVVGNINAKLSTLLP